MTHADTVHSLHPAFLCVQIIYLEVIRVALENGDPASGMRLLNPLAYQSRSKLPDMMDPRLPRSLHCRVVSPLLIITHPPNSPLGLDLHNPTSAPRE